MSNQKQSWSVVIFAYNEENTVVQVIEDTQIVLNIISPEKNEIIFVDDGSNDKTSEIAKEMKKKYSNLKLITHPVNKGTGFALRSGYAAAQCDNVVNISADAQFDVYELIPYAEIPPHTIISFCRGKKSDYSVFKHLLTYTNRIINRFLLGINLKDVNWTNAYKNDDLKKIELKLTSLLVESEICSKLIIAGSKVLEVPSVYYKRKSGKGKATSYKIVSQAAKDSIKIVFVILKYRFSQSKFL